VTQRLGLGVELRVPAPAAQVFDDAFEPVRVSVNPRRQPAAGVAAARDGREVVEAVEEAALRERLDDAERERAAAYAAAREADGRPLGRVQASDGPREPQVVDAPERPRKGVFEQEPPEPRQVGLEEAPPAQSPRAGRLPGRGALLLLAGEGGRAAPLYSQVEERARLPPQRPPPHPQPVEARVVEDRPPRRVRRAVLVLVAEHTVEQRVDVVRRAGRGVRGVPQPPIPEREEGVQLRLRLQLLRPRLGATLVRHRPVLRGVAQHRREQRRVLNVPFVEAPVVPDGDAVPGVSRGSARRGGGTTRRGGGRALLVLDRRGEGVLLRLAAPRRAGQVLQLLFEHLTEVQRQLDSILHGLHLRVAKGVLSRPVARGRRASRKL
jgi:hypothetical protein